MPVTIDRSSRAGVYSPRNQLPRAALSRALEPMDAASRQLTRPAFWGLALLALLYGGAHLGWYWGTPLGQSAVLDERENLQLAAQITAGTLPPEPFYRAMGYPLFLAALRVVGLLTDDLPQVATGAGLLLHVLNTLLVARLAQQWFDSARAGLVAGLLHGLNPVLIHEATQILDGTLANTFFLTGLCFLPAAVAAAPPRRPVVWLSLAWTAAALVRPNFMLAWLVLPGLWLIAGGQWRQWRAQLGSLLAALAAGGLLWFAQGVWQWRTSGGFRLLPWQGAYNLWAANQPGASGRYYSQFMLLAAPADGAQENPARIESILLYRHATGDRGPLRVDAVNDYWRQRLRADTLAHPTAWLRLQLRKAYYLTNNFEQYNNKTYSFHQARSPWLRLNPLGWGVVLLGGTLGLLVLRHRHRVLLGAVLLTGAAVAAGILLFYASGRFRLPLTVMFCVLAGGAALPGAWWPENRHDRAATALLLLTLGVVTFSGWFNAHDRSTYVQDHMLLARAAEHTGADRITWDEARAALAMRPGHPDALRLGLTSFSNLLMEGVQPTRAEAEWCGFARLLYTQTADPAAHPQANVMALALWRAHDPAGLALWRARLAAQDDPETLAALCLAGAADSDCLKRVTALPMPPKPGSFLLMAKARFAPTELDAWAMSQHQEKLPAALRQAVANVFHAAR